MTYQTNDCLSPKGRKEVCFVKPFIKLIALYVIYLIVKHLDD